MIQRIKSFSHRVDGYLRRRYHRLQSHLGHRALRKFIDLINARYPHLQTRLLDIGARRGIEGLYHGLTRLNHFHLEGIEPDREEARALLDHGYRKVHPVAIADEIGNKPLYVTKVLGCTSIHKPNMENVQRYTISPWFEVQAETTIPVTTLDSLYCNGETFDFVNMDVQGAEYEVIKGGERMFDRVLGFSMEAHFVEIYEEQKLFSFMHDLSLKKGFRLIQLYLCPFDGETAEAECVYVKDHQLIQTREDFLKCMLFALNWYSSAYVENMLRNAAPRILSATEKEQMYQALHIKEKHKVPHWPDGFSAKVHGDGSGYL
jgi:FkbM family methyltransferase